MPGRLQSHYPVKRTKKLNNTKFKTCFEGKNEKKIIEIKKKNMENKKIKK